MYRRNETSIFLLKIRCARSRPGEDVINEGGVQNPVFYRLKLALACGRIFGEAQLEPSLSPVENVLELVCSKTREVCRILNLLCDLLNIYRMFSTADRIQ